MKARKIRVIAAGFVAAMVVTAAAPVMADELSSGYVTNEAVSPVEAAQILKGIYPNLDVTDYDALVDQAMIVAQECVWLYHEAIPNARTPEEKANYEAQYREASHIIELLNIVRRAL